MGKKKRTLYLHDKIFEIAQALAERIGGEKGTVKEILSGAIVMFQEAGDRDRTHCLMSAYAIERGLPVVMYFNEHKLDLDLPRFFVLPRGSFDPARREEKGVAEILPGEVIPPHPDEWLRPILNHIGAGEPREATDREFPAGASDAYVRIPEGAMKLNASAYALYVDGQSMAPCFAHGDVIIADPTPMGRGVRSYASGMLAVVIFGSERTATFKQVFFGKMDRHQNPVDYLLRPLNAQFPSMRLEVGEIIRIDPVVALVHRRRL